MTSRYDHAIYNRRTKSFVCLFVHLCTLHTCINSAMTFHSKQCQHVNLSNLLRWNNRAVKVQVLPLQHNRYVRALG